MRAINLFLKRLIDFFGSLAGIIIISPILLAIALSIKVTSEGPVFFTQERLGKNGKLFKIIKFRTMIINAEHIGDGIRIKNESDFRITKIGRFLRITSLDELPQLFNVLIGNMSLVGPRPPVKYFPYDGYYSYPEWARQRFLMNPGMTGLAQVTVRNAVGWNDRFSLDNEYINKFNVWLDIKILFRTFIKVIRPKDLYMKADKRANISTVSNSESEEGKV